MRLTDNCHLRSIANKKNNIAITDNLRWLCYTLIELIGTISTKVELYIGYKSVILKVCLPNGMQQAYIFDPIEEPNIKFRNHACQKS